MKITRILFWLGLALAGFAPARAAEADVSAPSYDDALRRPLPVPENGDDRVYLGLAESSGTFTFGQVKADVLIVEILSMYCPYCQDSANSVNRVYSLLQKKGYGARVKLLGIAIADTPLETKLYKTKFNVSFPVLSDPNAGVRANFFYTETPYFVAIKLGVGAPPTVCFVSPGAFDDPELFVDTVLNKSGIANIKE